MADAINTKATFKRVADGFEVIIYQPRGVMVQISDVPLALANLGLAAEGDKETAVLQLAEGQELTLPVSVPIKPARWSGENRTIE